MSLQTIINSAQSIDITRQALVATSMSRSGRLLTAGRNWGKPWKFVVSAQPVFIYNDVREMIETIMTKDRIEEHIISLGASAGAAWTIQYMGELSTTNLNTGLTVNSESAGNLLRLDLNSAVQALAPSTVLFRAGDVIQPLGHRYPYVVTTNITRGTGTNVPIILNRGILPDTTALIGATIRAGVDCIWRVKVSKLPTIRLLPGKLVEFTSEFELIESII